MITSNKFIRAAYGEALREYLAENAHIEKLIDFGDLPVFPDVSAYPCIVLIVKGTSGPTRYLRVHSLEFDSLSSLMEISAAKLPMDAISGADWRLMSADEYAILKKMERKSVPLKVWLGEVHTRRGVLTGFNKAFFIDEETRARLIAEDPKSAELIKPLVIGEDIKRYEVEYKGRYLIFTRRGVDIDRYPAIKEHLEQFKAELTPRSPDWNPATQGPWSGRKQGSYKWYEIQDSINYYPDFEKPKIMYQEIAKSQAFVHDSNSFFGNNKLFIIPTESLYLLAILNASLIWLYLTSHVSKLHGDTFALQSIYMECLPIRRIAFTTPKEERARLVKEGKKLYRNALTKLGLEAEE